MEIPTNVGFTDKKRKAYTSAWDRTLSPVTYCFRHAIEAVLLGHHVVASVETEDMGCDMCLGREIEKV